MSAERFWAGRLTDKDLSGKLSFLIAPLRSSGVSISTDGRRNTSATFLQKEEATSLNNVVNKKYIKKSEWKRNYDLFSERPTGFTLCFSHVNVIFQSFFQKFLIGLRRICLRAKVRNLVSSLFCSLLVGMDCVTDKLKATFSWMKNALFCPQI